MPNAVVQIQGLGELRQRLGNAAAAIQARKLLNEIGLYLRLRILERTSQGVDVNENPFWPYSPEYAFFRDMAGLPTSRVDLFFTGSMLSSMTFETSSDQVRLFFAPTEDKFGGSNPEKAYFLNEDREFFAISDDDVDTIVDIAEARIARALRKGSGGTR